MAYIILGPGLSPGGRPSPHAPGLFPWWAVEPEEGGEYTPPIAPPSPPPLPSGPYQSSVMRAFLDAIEPPGPIWQPKPGGDEDNLRAAISDCLQYVMDALGGMLIRDPYSTGYLDELEREYGITPNTQLTTAQRTATLAARKFQRQVKSTANTLQNALDLAGFGVGGYGLQVLANDPPVDPGPFAVGAFQTYTGNTTACCGYNLGGPILAFCGMATGGGLWIVNGDAFTSSPNYLAQSGSTTSFSGYIAAGSSQSLVLSGYYETISYKPIYITSPADSWAWPMVFFIAAGCTRAGDGHITSISQGSFPGNLWTTFVEIICRFKPIHTWCLAMITRA